MEIPEFLSIFVFVTSALGFGWFVVSRSIERKKSIETLIRKKDLEIENLNQELKQKEDQLQRSTKSANDFSDKLYLSYAQLTNLDFLLREVNSCKDLKEIMVILAKYLQDKFKIPHYVLYTYNEEEGYLVCYDSNFPSGLSQNSIQEIRSRKIPISNQYVTKYAHAYVWKRKRTFFIPDMNEYKSSGVELLNQISVNLRSLLIVPLYLRQRFIGTLDLLDYTGNLKLTDQEINQIKIIADYIAGSIETAFLMDKLQITNQRIQLEKEQIERNREKIESNNKLLRKINSFNELDDIAGEVLLFLKTFHRVELAFLLLYDDKEKILKPLLTSKEIFNKGLLVNNFFRNFKVELKPESGSLYRTFKRQKPLFIKHFMDSSGLASHDRKIVDAFNLSSIAQIPLVVRNQCIGILCLTRLTKEMDWTRNEFIEICSFSEQVAGAIHNANLLKDLGNEKEKSASMLRNILPDELAQELMQTGSVIPMEYESATILFTDFKNFTSSAEMLSPEDLIFQLDAVFSQFDDIALRHSMEKLKTIGDSYMAAGGIPQGNFTHPVDACLFALEIRTFMNTIMMTKKLKGLPFWEIRIGIHTGSVVAGVVGKTKFAYDIWGDTVNTASRMESSSIAGEINLSESTYEKVKRFFDFEFRGKVEAKNKGELGMYFLKRLKPEFSLDRDGISPNDTFKTLYKNLQIGAKIIYKHNISEPAS
jgi:class 3 adenylate cyclase